VKPKNTSYEDLLSHREQLKSMLQAKKELISSDIEATRNEARGEKTEVIIVAKCKRK